MSPGLLNPDLSGRTATDHIVRVVQVGDVAAVGPALEAALAGRAEVISVPFPQAGARQPMWLKAAYAPFRMVQALRVGRAVNRLRPDVVHIHWLPNALVGPVLTAPWIIHCHGSDVRGLIGWRLRMFPMLLRRADAVVYSTPDLGPWVLPFRPDAVYLPTPIPEGLPAAPATRDVLVGARAANVKGSDVAAAALRILRQARPALRVAAVDGPDFNHPAERLPFMPKGEFLAEIAQSRVVLGQFALRALGITELEAMSCGRPVVSAVDASLYPTPPPVRDARTPEQIAIEVGRLLDDADAAMRLGELGRAWVRESHAPEDVAARMVEVYGRVIGTDPEARP